MSDVRTGVGERLTKQTPLFTAGKHIRPPSQRFIKVNSKSELTSDSFAITCSGLANEF